MTVKRAKEFQSLSHEAMELVNQLDLVGFQKLKKSIKVKVAQSGRFNWISGNKFSQTNFSQTAILLSSQEWFHCCCTWPSEWCDCSNADCLAISSHQKGCRTTIGQCFKGLEASGKKEWPGWVLCWLKICKLRWSTNCLAQEFSTIIVWVSLKDRRNITERSRKWLVEMISGFEQLLLSGHECSFTTQSQ